mgnify:CR=1 FL=1
MRTMLPQDTIVSIPVADEPVVSAVIADTTVRKPLRPQTPYQVLRMLPRDATPAQQDSAIQAWFQPGEIRYSSQPDTLHLPGHDKGRSPKDVSLPQYYRETYFANDTLLHPELQGGRIGVAGDPVPYTVRGDNAITAMLIFCFVSTFVVFSYYRQQIIHQLKDFFYPPKTASAAGEPDSLFQYFLCLQTCLLLGVSYYFYMIYYVTDSLIIDTPYQLIGIFSAVFVAYFIVKAVLYQAVNTVFFDMKKSQHWNWCFTWITVLEGILIFPAVMLQVYFSMHVHSVIYYLISALFLAKLFTFFKCWNIFFRQNGIFLQIILYLCALEIVPMLVLWGVLVLITNELTVIF